MNLIRCFYKSKEMISGRAGSVSVF